MNADTVLWSADINDPNAEAVFRQVQATMPSAVLMALCIDRVINPVSADRVGGLCWPLQDQGWLFSREGELKWRRLQGGLLRFVYLGTATVGQPDSATDGSPFLEGLAQTETQMVAWGTRDGDCWREEQVPHRFDYPGAPSGPSGVPLRLSYRAFKVRQYHDRTSGALAFWRHLAMGPAEQGNREN